MGSILLAVTGMTPQVVTETLYGLVEKGESWPDRLVIITTRQGASRVQEGLFEHGHLARLCQALDRPLLTPDRVSIHMVPGADGNPVDDARTLDDHESLADFIMDQVRRLTANDDCAVHASIAGGRKTMTFYLGYAMSLFGRPQDRMSHVLVSEGFESHPDFYFPTRDSRLITLPDGSRLDMRDARVNLADIPFIRQRGHLPGALRASGSDMSFRQLVDLINLGQRPESIRAVWHDAEMCLELRDTQRTLGKVMFASRFDWSWYQAVAEATRSGDASLRRSGEGGSEHLGRCLMEQLASSLPLPLEPALGYREQLALWLDRYEDVLESAGIRPVDFDASMRLGLDVAQATTRINRRLTEALPDALARYLKIMQVFDVQGRHLAKTTRGGGYGLLLRSKQIVIAE